MAKSINFFLLKYQVCGIVYDVEVIVARMSRKMKLALLWYNFGDACLLLVLCVIIIQV
jgi:hypothetical protein